jgi:hypothetical protein
MHVQISLVIDGTETPITGITDSDTHDGSCAILRFGDQLIVYQSKKSPGACAYDFADYLTTLGNQMRDAAYHYERRNLDQLVLGDPR